MVRKPDDADRVLTVSRFGKETQGAAHKPLHLAFIGHACRRIEEQIDGAAQPWLPDEPAGDTPGEFGSWLGLNSSLNFIFALAVDTVLQHICDTVLVRHLTLLGQADDVTVYAKNTPQLSP